MATGTQTVRLFEVGQSGRGGNRFKGIFSFNGEDVRHIAGDYPGMAQDLVLAAVETGQHHEDTDRYTSYWATELPDGDERIQMLLTDYGVEFVADLLGKQALYLQEEESSEQYEAVTIGPAGLVEFMAKAAQRELEAGRQINLLMGLWEKSTPQVFNHWSDNLLAAIKVAVDTIPTDRKGPLKMWSSEYYVRIGYSL